jgi:hypothetical protein
VQLKIKMEIKRKSLHICILVVVFLPLFIFKGNAQYPGSLMMLPDNFYSQTMNPAYMRTDKAITVAVPGLAGFSFKNTGSFKISDVIVVNNDGNPELDFERFYDRNKSKNFMGTNVSVPLIFISTPTYKGVFSFYYQERAQMLSTFKSAIVDYINHGNQLPEYKNFNSEKINSLSLGISEFSFGYAQKVDEKISIGIHGKILFGKIIYSAKDWEYGIGTSESGDKIKLTSKGTGKMSFPVPVYLGYNEQVYYIDGSNAVHNYFTSYKNPGIAIDLGLTWNLSSSSSMSFAVRDLGGIWFKKNGLNLKLNNSYNFVGFDLENAIRYQEEYGYINPLNSVLATKEDIRNVYRPIGDTVKFVKAMPPQTVIHYQLKSSEKLEFGITNQSVFQNKLFYNSFTFSALQKSANFSLIESVNIHQISSLSIGGGFQYTGKLVQVFLLADNVFAFYHPANNKTFSLTVGMCFLFNHEKNEGNPNGRFLPHLPFYRIKD